MVKARTNVLQVDEDEAEKSSDFVTEFTYILLHTAEHGHRMITSGLVNLLTDISSEIFF